MPFPTTTYWNDILLSTSHFPLPTAQKPLSSRPPTNFPRFTSISSLDTKFLRTLPSFAHWRNPHSGAEAERRDLDLLWTGRMSLAGLFWRGPKELRWYDEQREAEEVQRGDIKLVDEGFWHEWRRARLEKMEKRVKALEEEAEDAEAEIEELEGDLEDVEAECKKLRKEVKRLRKAGYAESAGAEGAAAVQSEQTPLLAVERSETTATQYSDLPQQKPQSAPARPNDLPQLTRPNGQRASTSPTDFHIETAAEKPSKHLPNAFNITSPRSHSDLRDIADAIRLVYPYQAINPYLEPHLSLATQLRDEPTAHPHQNFVYHIDGTPLSPDSQHSALKKAADKFVCFILDAQNISDVDGLREHIDALTDEIQAVYPKCKTAAIVTHLWDKATRIRREEDEYVRETQQRRHDGETGSSSSRPELRKTPLSTAHTLSPSGTASTLSNRAEEQPATGISLASTARYSPFRSDAFVVPDYKLNRAEDEYTASSSTSTLRLSRSQAGADAAFTNVRTAPQRPDVMDAESLLWMEWPRVEIGAVGGSSKGKGRESVIGKWDSRKEGARE